MRVVDLDHQAGVDDGAVLLRQGLGDSKNVFLFAAVELVFARRRHAGGSDHWQEGVKGADADHRRFEVLYVSLQGLVARVPHGPDTDPVPGHADEALRLSIFLIELGKQPLVRTRGDDIARLGCGRRTPPFETVKAFADVARPALRLAELPITDDVDATLRLLAYDLGHALSQSVLIGAFVVCLPVFLGSEDVDELRGTDEAADMRGQNLRHSSAPCLTKAGGGNGTAETPGGEDQGRPAHIPTTGLDRTVCEPQLITAFAASRWLWSVVLGSSPGWRPKPQYPAIPNSGR